MNSVSHRGEYKHVRNESYDSRFWGATDISQTYEESKDITQVEQDEDVTVPGQGADVVFDFDDSVKRPGKRQFFRSAAQDMLRKDEE